MRWRRSKDEESDAPEETTETTETTDATEALEVEREPVEEVLVPVDLGRVDADELRRVSRRVVARALTEDLAGRTDITSALTIPAGTRGRAVLVARQAGVLAGLGLVEEVCSQVDHRLEVRLTHFDGDAVRRGTVVAEVEGPLRTLLTAERTFLNLVCRLSGIATRTRRFAVELEGTGCVVRDTRKTTPGLRLLEKHAVAVGGGANHRIGLYDAVLVKDNHVAAAGGVGAAARAALDGAPDGVHVQVEVTSLAEAEEAMAEGVTDLLLDNFTPEELRAAVEAIDGRAAVEASGGITLETARAFAEAGADRLAVGALTHSAPAMDLALDVVEVTGPERRGGDVAPTPAAAAERVAEDPPTAAPEPETATGEPEAHGSENDAPGDDAPEAGEPWTGEPLFAGVGAGAEAGEDADEDTDDDADDDGTD